MARKFTENKLLIASNNPGKVKEIKDLLAPYNIEILSVSDLNVEEPEETGLTFVDNARLKAEYYGKIKNMPALADDSGLSIEALDGFPGVYSARFAGPDRNFYSAFDMIEKKLQDINLSTSKAFFTCALALWWPDGHFETFEGTLNGNLSFPPSGKLGFGYAPIFIPKGHNVTFANFQDEEKNKISHRAEAFNQMIKACF
jgi:XTP/dITP diphosphohydrolase